MFTAPYAVVHYSRVGGQVKLGATVLEYSPSEGTLKSFERIYYEKYAGASTQATEYLLLEREKNGGIQDYYTKRWVGYGDAGRGRAGRGPFRDSRK